MELFSEIYSCYYNVITKILNTSLEKPLNKNDINEIIEDNAFSESAFYILPKLIDGEWNLMKNVGDKYVSKLNGAIKPPITTLEKSWLKTLLLDKRISLFLNKEQIILLKEYLKDVNPLFDINDFYYYDTFLDGDDYENEDYIQNFHKVIAALKNKTPLTISFESPKSNHITGNYIPCKLEYSSKDDKFRLYALRIRYGKIITTTIINLTRITSICDSKETFNSSNINFDAYIKQNKKHVIIEISKERNAVERCMLHFANFQKHTEYDEEKDKYISYIYYDGRDETELLIRILSFGPVIRVLGPEKFLDLIKERINRQWELIK